MARGEYFKWAAHDDLLDPFFLEYLVELLDSDPECVLAYPTTILIDENSAVIGKYSDKLFLESDEPSARLRQWLIPPKKLCNPVFGLIRKEVMAKTPLHGAYLDSDRVFLASIALQGRCRTIPNGLFFRRIHPENSTTANPNHRDRLAWFVGRKPVLPVLKNWCLFYGYIKAINGAKLCLQERFRSYRVMWSWIILKKKLLVLEILLPIQLNGRKTRLGKEIVSLFRFLLSTIVSKGRRMSQEVNAPELR
jgi:hypothetical protein